MQLGFGFRRNINILSPMPKPCFEIDKKFYADPGFSADSCKSADLKKYAVDAGDDKYLRKLQKD